MSTVIIGVDPSRKGNHEICVICQEEVLYRAKVEGNQACIDKMIDLVALYRKTDEIIIGIEHTDGTLLEEALQVGVPVYSLPASKVRKYIGAILNADKSDPIDAYGCCRYLAAARNDLTTYQPPSAVVKEARDIAGQLGTIREQKTKTQQRFWAITDRFSPALKTVVGKGIKTEWFLTLMTELFPKEKFQHTGLPGFCRYCRARKSEMEEENLKMVLASLKKIHQGAMPMLLSMQAKSLLALQEEEKVWVSMAKETLRRWPEGIIALTISGLGPKTLIRLLAYVGDGDWSDTSPMRIAAYSGTAPVVSSTGTPSKMALRKMSAKKRKRYEPKRFHRYACNRELKTALSLFAFATLSRHAWAEKAYWRYRRRGQGHWEALRNLASKWLRIIYRMVRTQQPYQTHIHESNIARRNDPLVTKQAS